MNANLKNAANKNLWIRAEQLPEARYRNLHSWVAGIAGEGEEISPESLGMLPRNFSYGRLMIVGRDGYDLVYSLSEDGGVCLEVFRKQ